MKRFVIILSAVAALFSSCRQNEKSSASPADQVAASSKWKKPEKMGYEFRNAKEWLQNDSLYNHSRRAIVFALNRVDSTHFAKMDSVIVPVDLSGDVVYYFPFPLEVSTLKDVDKIIFFSYATQSFGAYEKGELVYTGPTSMGREKDQTPTGLFYTNWKAKKTISTFNDEWELKWNFNILNKAGVGWHQYSMPGYPDSHSCLRLTARDAKYLYTWADQWVLANKTTIRVKGTPVMVFGSYDFKGPKPWLQLVQDPHALDISETEIQQLVAPFLDQILADQKIREDYEASKTMRTKNE
ncbi:L,D-transpeptidase [Fluviicola sp.]|uniref:L,D-transpeptidase n=1 Tax=Fluviicola sp. TaxID=1917219 RepID=UPI0031E1BC43